MKLPGNPQVARDGQMIVFRTAELAKTAARPLEPNFADEPMGDCEACNKPFEEVFITTGGPMGDDDLFRDMPIAVDGWMCLGCGTFRYPRRIEPAQINAWIAEGAEHGRAGRFAEAELCFLRVTWDWPGYPIGHVNYAEATRDRIRKSGAALDDAQRRRLERRMLDSYDDAIEGYGKRPQASSIPVVAHACRAGAELAMKDRQHERARRYLTRLLTLDGVPEKDIERGKQLLEYVQTRHDLFEEAASVVFERIQLVDRPARGPQSPEDRKAIADAIDKLEEHLQHAPDRWQSAWLHAKSLLLLGKKAEGFAAFERAFARFPSVRDIGRDYSHDLLLEGRIADARRIARTLVERTNDDATLWCNLAVAELLSGDLDAAEKALTSSRALDPNDRIAGLLAQRIASYRGGKPLPRSLEELQRG